MYDDLVVELFRNFQFSSMAEVNALTIPECNLLTKAAELKMVDQIYHDHLTAFATMRASATRKSGKDKVKPVYDRFDKFFDYKEAVRDVLHPPKDKKKCSYLDDPHFRDLARKMNKERGQDG